MVVSFRLSFGHLSLSCRKPDGTVPAPRCQIHLSFRYDCRDEVDFGAIQLAECWLDTAAIFILVGLHLGTHRAQLSQIGSAAFTVTTEAVGAFSKSTTPTRINDGSPRSLWMKNLLAKVVAQYLCLQPTLLAKRTEHPGKKYQKNRRVG